jgi:hypothetical protein
MAVIGWGITPAALLLSNYVSFPLRGIEDLATLGLSLVIAVAIAVGGRIGRAGAGVGGVLAGTVACLVSYIVLSGCLGRCGGFAWLGPIGAAALSAVSFLAARHMGTMQPTDSVA